MLRTKFSPAPLAASLAISLGTLLIAAPHSHARLGETVAECEKRYGEVLERIKPQSPASDEYATVFRMAGVRIVVEYKDGTAWKINYEGTGDLAANFVALLRSNNDDQPWGDAFNAFGKKHWIRPDGKAHAIGSSDRNYALLTVFDDAFLKARSAAYQARLANADNERAKYLNEANPLPGF